MHLAAACRYVPVTSNVRWHVTEFPDQNDLIGIFEAEPTLVDPDVPWFYNHLTFTTRRGPDLVVCEIEPASGEFSASWTQDGQLRLSAQLNYVEKIEVHMNRGDEYLMVTGSDRHPVVLKLRLCPQVAIEMSCVWHP